MFSCLHLFLYFKNRNANALEFNSVRVLQKFFLITNRKRNKKSVKKNNETITNNKNNSGWNAESNHLITYAVLDPDQEYVNEKSAIFIVCP